MGIIRTPSPKLKEVRMSFFHATYGHVISGLSHNGKPVQAAVFNDNQVRAAAGLALVLAAVALVYGRFESVYLPMQAVTTFLFVEYLIRVTIGIQYSPLGVLAGWMVQRKGPDWASARPKRFAWTLALIMSGAMMVMTNAGVTGAVPLTICVIFMLLLWMESVLGLCVGCEFHGFMVKQGWVQKDSAFEICAHGACDIPPR
ncbi:DUF4395 family protein [Ramlibacter sp. MAH-25]|uniref:DUF4395 family protein n=2 Tax=Comamonadaceae TaxID=80864 RepID=A0A6N8IXZ1_9BURK|nr:DUF4395 family protein [Ramlibacter pinisoli]